MNNEKQRIQADLKLEELKDKAREWDILAKENLELRKEIERLINIIKELEKWLEEDENKAMITFETGRCFNYHDIINKIEILKGVDKE